MILTRDGKEITAIYKQDGAEIEEVKDANGRILYLASREITGTSPLSFYSLGKPLTNYRISGDTVQNGTPSPDMPVDVVGCGEKTENLFDISKVESGPDAYGGSIAVNNNAIVVTTSEISSNVISPGNKTLQDLTENLVVGETYTIFANTTGSTNIFLYGANVVVAFRTAFMLTSKMLTSIVCWYALGRNSTATITNFMLVKGSTPPDHYEPYGYKLPVTTTNGTDTVTTPVYIGAEPLHRIGEYADYVDYASGKIVRKIKKLVLTGTENCTRSASFTSPDAYCYAFLYAAIGMTDIVYNDVNMALIPYPQYVCSHFKMKPSPSLTQDDDFRNIRDGEIGANTIKRAATGGAITYNRYLILCSSQYVTVDDFKSYLAAQYAAGTPVTVWYVLETQIEEDPPVPLPAIPTLSGINTLSVDTTVKPSQMYIKGKIKPDGYGKLTDKNGVYILDKDGVSLTVHGQGASN